MTGDTGAKITVLVPRTQRGVVPAYRREQIPRAMQLEAAVSLQRRRLGV